MKRLHPLLLAVATLGLPVILAGCDDDIGTDGVIGIIYAAGEVVLWILDAVL